MSHIDPSLLTQLVAAGLATACVSLVTAIGTLIVAIANRISRRADTVQLTAKLDANTALTQDIHKVTNGPLSSMGQDITNLATQAATNAAAAVATADAAKTQAATDAKAASKGK